MNKNNQKLVPICIVFAVIIFIAILFLQCAPQWEEYQAARASAISAEKERQDLQQKINNIESEKALMDMKMKNLKTIVETNVDSSAGNLGMFGTLFEQILGKAQRNGLLIRSIAYDLNPHNDPIYIKDPNDYNICELKLSLVGSYSQLRTFLADINMLENLVFISKMDVTAFAANTDYLIIDLSINLYSKKAQPSGRTAAPLGPPQRK